MKKYLKKIISGQDLTEVEVEIVGKKIFSGELSDVEISAFLVALATKGETVDEIKGMVKVMREYMVKVDVGDNMLDTCGTGGDGHDTFNVSTISAFVCAELGVKVAKHGNRSVSSKCGSFDVLEKLGLKIDLGPEEVKASIEKNGIGFMFAPKYHPIMKYVMPVRKKLGVRTIFNFLGPLLNPAQADHQLIGVSSEKVARTLGEVLMDLGSKKVLLVHSQDGLDEISPATPSRVYEFVQGRPMRTYMVESPHYHSLDDVRGGSVEENAKIFQDILSGNGTDAQNEFVALNVSGALLAAEFVSTFKEGRIKALDILLSGKTLVKLEELRNLFM